MSRMSDYLVYVQETGKNPYGLKIPTELISEQVNEEYQEFLNNLPPLTEEEINDMANVFGEE